MVGGNTCCGIAVALVSRQSGGMAVNRFAIAECSLDLGHHLLVVSQHARVVHHLTQETNVVTCHQRLCVFDVNHLSAGLNVTAYSRYAAGGTEKEVEVSLPSGADHIVDTLNAQHIANLVRVGNDADCSVADGDACKLMWHNHAALNVYVTVNEAWHQVRPGFLPFRQLTPLHLYNFLTFDNQFAVVDFAAHDIYDMSFYLFHILKIFLCGSQLFTLQSSLFTFSSRGRSSS